jgi:hypothetical protein
VPLAKVPNEPPPPGLLAAPPLPPLPLGCPDAVPCEPVLLLPLTLFPGLHEATARTIAVTQANKLQK